MFKKNAGGDLGGEDYVGTLANSGVRIAPFHDLDSAGPGRAQDRDRPAEGGHRRRRVKVSDYLK